MAASISIAISCKNEAPRIGRVLDSVAALVVGGGEVLAVDSGSTDGTVEILRERGCRVIETHWRGFNATRQFSMENCRYPWILCLDADEPLDPELAEAVRGVVMRDDPAVIGGRVNRVVYYRGRPLRHAWQPEWRLRLLRAGVARTAGVEPHDKIEIIPGTAGRVLDLPGHVRHESISTFAEFLRKQAGLSRASALALYAAGGRGGRLALVTSPAGAFFKQLIMKRAILDGAPGWMAAASQAAATLMKHIDLLELTAAGGPERAEDPTRDPRA